MGRYAIIENNIDLMNRLLKVEELKVGEKDLEPNYTA